MVAAKVVAVAVGQHLSSKGAVRWALENLLSENDVLQLVHVRPPLHTIPTPLGGYVPISHLNEDIVATYRRDIETKTEKLFCSYKKHCHDHKVKVDCEVIENDSVPKGLLEYIKRTSMPTLVLGISFQNKLTRKLMGLGIAAYVSKHAPSFCSILVVSKNRLLSVKDVTFSSTTPRSASGSPKSAEAFGDLAAAGLLSHKTERREKSGSTVHLASQSCEDDIFSHSYPLHASKEASYLKWMDQSLMKLYERKLIISPFSTPGAADKACYRVPGSLASKGAISVDEISNTQKNIRSVTNNSTLLKNGQISSVLQLENIHEAANRECDCSTDARSVSNFELQNHLPLNSYDQEVENLEQLLEEILSLAGKARENADFQALLRIRAENSAFKATEKARMYAGKLFEEAKKREKTLIAEKMARKIASKEAEIQKTVELVKCIATPGMLHQSAIEAKFVEEAEARDVGGTLELAKQNYRVYDYDELEASTMDFSSHLKIGEGGYGSVYKGKLHNMTVAIKVLKEDGFQGPREFLREVELLSHIHHPHLVLLLGCCPEKGCLVYEYMQNGSLEDHLSYRGCREPLPWFTRFRIIAEVANATHFLHSSCPVPIVHRDLKPDNILLDGNFVSKLSDFGLAGLAPRRLEDGNSSCFLGTTPVGSFAYMDPEYQRTGLFGPKSDVYALGIIMLQLLTGKAPLGIHEIVEEALDHGKLNEVLDQSAGEWPYIETMEVATLALQCAEMKRKHRPDLETVVLPVLDSVRSHGEKCVMKEACIWPVSGEHH